ncbi:MAG: hypothetical protein JWN32_4327, partial [Solirubrobacterales bacterium]|nr:hypothetical protein [Solirubrobacterales bacterium]
ELLGDEPRRRALAASAEAAVRAHLTPGLAARVESALRAAMDSRLE